MACPLNKYHKENKRPVKLLKTPPCEQTQLPHKYMVMVGSLLANEPCIHLWNIHAVNPPSVDSYPLNFNEQLNNDSHV